MEDGQFWQCPRNVLLNQARDFNVCFVRFGKQLAREYGWCFNFVLDFVVRQGCTRHQSAQRIASFLYEFLDSEVLLLEGLETVASLLSLFDPKFLAPLHWEDA